MNSGKLTPSPPKSAGTRSAPNPAAVSSSTCSVGNVRFRSRSTVPRLILSKIGAKRARKSMGFSAACVVPTEAPRVPVVITNAPLHGSNFYGYLLQALIGGWLRGEHSDRESAHLGAQPASEFFQHRRSAHAALIPHICGGRDHDAAVPGPQVLQSLQRCLESEIGAS